MKKIILFSLLAFLLPKLVFAQTLSQHGVVKTRGRMVNGQLQPGQKLAGATVQVKDRSAVVSGNDGTFSFPVPDKTFLLQSVKKQGYQLVDMEVCRAHQYSANPLYLVMETPEQQRSDLLAAERKIRRNLQRQLQQKEDQIEALNISVEEKEKRLQELYQQQGDNEKLISEMAQRYANLDYDQLDEFYRQVNFLIENGELYRADSLLRTCGDINAQVKDIIKQGKVIQEQKEQIQQAESVHQADMEEAACRCYSFYQTFLCQHQNDSAAYYLELRASLDTTNLKWQIEAGKHYTEFLGMHEYALSFYQRALRQSVFQYDNQEIDVSMIFLSISGILERQGKYQEALEYAYNALNNITPKIYDLTQNSDSVNGETLAIYIMILENLGGICSDYGLYDDALKYYTDALVIGEKISTELPSLPESYNNIGYIYLLQKKYPQALENFQKALAIGEKIWSSENLILATVLSNIGSVYHAQNDSKAALEYYTRALDVDIKVLGPEHPNVAHLYNNIGIVNEVLGNSRIALENFTKALDIGIKRLGPEHPDIAQYYDNIGSFYYRQGDCSKALEYQFSALKIWMLNEEANSLNRAETLCAIGLTFSKMKNYDEAKKYYNYALTICKSYDPDLTHKSKIMEDIYHIYYLQYENALSTNDMTAFLSEYAFTITIIEGDTPAHQQGLTGEYYLFEFADWHQECNVSLFEKNEELRGKSKHIVVMKSGQITRNYFENTIGGQFRVKYVGKEEKQRINKAYEDWKMQNRK